MERHPFETLTLIFEEWHPEKASDLLNIIAWEKRFKRSAMKDMSPLAQKKGTIHLSSEQIHHALAYRVWLSTQI